MQHLHLNEELFLDNVHNVFLSTRRGDFYYINSINYKYSIVNQKLYYS